MQPRIIEYPPIPGHRCFACVFKDRDNQTSGVYCADTKNGRMVTEYGGSAILDQMLLGVSIRHCLENTDLENDDNFHRLAQIMLKYLMLHRINFVQPNPDDQELLRSNEPNCCLRNNRFFDTLQSRNFSLDQFC